MSQEGPLKGPSCASSRRQRIRPSDARKLAAMVNPSLFKELVQDYSRSCRFVAVGHAFGASCDVSNQLSPVTSRPLEQEQNQWAVK